MRGSQLSTIPDLRPRSGATVIYQVDGNERARSAVDRQALNTHSKKSANNVLKEGSSQNRKLVSSIVLQTAFNQANRSTKTGRRLKNPLQKAPRQRVSPKPWYFGETIGTERTVRQEE